jgi:YbgC/YbaW family acyl-CoA thioester hydrolase
LSAPFVSVHRVRLDEVDAAGIVYFAHFFSWCHEAMAEMLSPVDGGYAALVMTRRLGLPAVHVEADFAAPVRFGDEVRVVTVVERVGTSSCGLRFDLERTSDGDHIATLRHVVAFTDLAAMRSRPLPDDVLRVLARYR